MPCRRGGHIYISGAAPPRNLSHIVTAVLPAPLKPLQLLGFSRHPPCDHGLFQSHGIVTQSHLQGFRYAVTWSKLLLLRNKISDDGNNRRTPSGLPPPAQRGRR